MVYCMTANMLSDSTEHAHKHHRPLGSGNNYAHQEAQMWPALWGAEESLGEYMQHTLCHLATESEKSHM